MEKSQIWQEIGFVGYAGESPPVQIGSTIDIRINPNAVDACGLRIAGKVIQIECTNSTGSVMMQGTASWARDIGKHLIRLADTIDPH